MLKRLLKRSPVVYAAWRRLRGSSLLPLRGVPSVSERALRRHARIALDGDPSYAGEAWHLRNLLRRCGIEGGFVVDLGAGDGVFQSCTLFLFRDPAWRGIAVEMDPLRFRRLETAYRQFPNARPVRHKVTPASVSDLLAGHDVPTEFEVLNLDWTPTTCASPRPCSGGFGRPS